MIALDEMKVRQRSEIGEIGSRLSLVADELVWQKRMAVVQSTLLLLCLGLVLFVRSGTLGASQNEGMPIAQQLGNKYSQYFMESPPRSPAENETSGLGRRRRTFRNMWRSDTSAGLSDGGMTSAAETEGNRSPVQVAFSPPSPETPGVETDGGEVEGSSGESPAEGNDDERKRRDDSAIGDEEGSGLLRTNTTSTNGSFRDERDHDEARRLEALATQSGPATPRGSRDTRPSWEEVDRAVDLLKAGEKGRDDGGRWKRNKKERDKHRRSPLRRSESYDDTGADNSPGGDDGEAMFLG